MSSSSVASAVTAASPEGCGKTAVVGALLSRVLATPGLLEACTAYQHGDSFLSYDDGDLAAAQGHLSLLRLRRALCREGKREETGHDSKVSHGFCGRSRSRSGITDAGENSGIGEEDQDESHPLLLANDEEDVGREGDGPLLNDLKFSHRAADWAAAQGHLEVVWWLLANRDEGCTESAVDGACWNGHEATVRWLVCEWKQAGSERALDYAASTGRIELVKWLSRRPGSTCTVAAMDGAAGGGYLDVVRWLAGNRQEGCSQAAFEMAASKGHLDVIKWLNEARLLRCSSTGLDSAAGGGHLSVLEWMLDHKAHHRCSSNAYGLAASRGHLDVCEWLQLRMPDLRCPAWAAEAAAAAGHLEVVHWLHASGICRASLANLDEVAREGQLRALIWLSERGARASTSAVDRAAEAGRLGTVEYLLQHRREGCSSEALVGAARNGHLAVVKLLRELCPEQLARHGLKARAVAAAAGHGAVSRWLDENDPDLLRALQEAVVSSESSIGSGDGISSSSSSSSESSSSGGSNGDDGDDSSSRVQQAEDFEEEEDGSLSEEKGGSTIARPDESEFSSGGDDDSSSSNFQQAECDDENDNDDNSFFSACSRCEDPDDVDKCCSRDSKDGVVTCGVASGDDGDEGGWANNCLAPADSAHSSRHLVPQVFDRLLTSSLPRRRGATIVP